jgi:hypothetical protein
LYPELLRQRAELLSQSDLPAARENFLRAVRLGLDHGNLTSALMAACGLIDLEQGAGQALPESLDLLNQVYTAFPKDMELPMLAKARELLGDRAIPE